MPLSILYTLTAYPPSIGGAQLLQHNTAIHLSARHIIQVVSHWKSNRSDWLLGTTLRAPEAPHDYVVDGIPVHQLALSMQEKISLLPAVALYYPWMGLAVRHISSTIEPRLKPYAAAADLIHNVRIGREGLSHASLAAARAHDIPFVLTPVHHPRWRGWRYRIFTQIYREADALLALTAAEKDILVHMGVAEARIHVIGMGPILASESSASSFRTEHQLDGPIVLFIGQKYRYKGYRELVRATANVWERNPTVNFVFIGPEVGDSLKVFSGFPDPRILNLGKTDLQTKTDALAACTILCVPSTQESFGGVYTEAWSFGKPVIGCGIPAVSEVITENEDGLLVKQEAGSIADAICQLLASPSLAEAMGRAGRMKVQERYTWESIAARTENAYNQVLGNQPNSSSSALKP